MIDHQAQPLAFGGAQETADCEEFGHVGIDLVDAGIRGEPFAYGLADAAQGILIGNGFGIGHGMVLSKPDAKQNPRRIAPAGVALPEGSCPGYQKKSWITSTTSPV